MTIDEAKSLKPGTGVFYVQCHAGMPFQIIDTCIRGTDRKDPSYADIKYQAGMVKVYRLHRTMKEARADMRAIITERITKLETELKNWQD